MAKKKPVVEEVKKPAVFSKDQIMAEIKFQCEKTVRVWNRNPISSEVNTEVELLQHLCKIFLEL